MLRTQRGLQLDGTDWDGGIANFPTPNQLRIFLEHLLADIPSCYFLDPFSHSLIPSTSRLRINYISIDSPLGRGIDIHRPPSAARPDVYSTTQESDLMHYAGITLFIVFLGGVGPRRPLRRTEKLSKTVLMDRGSLTFSRLQCAQITHMNSLDMYI